jgi:hypothetical protein
MGGIRWLHLPAALQNTPSLSVLVMVPSAFRESPIETVVEGEETASPIPCRAIILGFALELSVLIRKSVTAARSRRVDGSLTPLAQTPETNLWLSSNQSLL